MKPTLSDEHIQTMRGIAELTPAYQEYAALLGNHITAALMSILLIEKAETKVQEEMYRAKATQALNDAVTLIRKVGV